MAATLDRRGMQLAACLNAASVRKDPQGPAVAVGAPGTTVDVWRADLDALTDNLVELLSPEEHARAARMVRTEDRARWTRARGALRALLGDYLECDPLTLTFTTDPHGKPTLARQGELCFNLSHSGALAVYAFTQGLAVGVDVEAFDRHAHRDNLALAERAFAPEVVEHLRTLAPAARRREFLREWVRHEARLKCLGVGLTGSARLAASGSPELWESELDIGRGAVAAVAVQMEPRQPPA
jgi:4'-phosphopantetheinyl transferase